MRSPIMGALTYLIVAALVATEAAMYLFRYSKVKDYYKGFQADPAGTGTDWFWLGDLIQSYANLGLFGLAFISQLLALFGILGGFNMIVWPTKSRWATSNTNNKTDRTIVATIV